MSRAITLTTDFGYSDAYVAAMKGVILEINSEARIIDVSHCIQPHNIAQAAYVLSTAWSCFPEGAIHVAVVDPGVGSARRAVILETPRALFVSPDNGVLTRVMEGVSPTGEGDEPAVGNGAELHRVLPPGLRAVAITKASFWRHPVSSTFHGCDIFAPVAAHLSLGTPIEEFGESVDALRVLQIARPQVEPDGGLRGHVIHIDHFGDLITDIEREHIQSSDLMIEISGRKVCGLSTCYSEGDDVLALVGSSDHLEIAAKTGNAAELLGAKVGDELKVWNWKDGTRNG
jgi:S-adenosylmethionine hydrolase